MKKAVGILLAFILMFNVSLGYTLTVNTARGTTTRDIASERVVTVGLSDRSPANYVVNTSNAILKVFGNRRQFVMPNEAVNISITDPAAVVNRYTITATAGANGTINPVGVTEVEEGANQTYTITPNSGYNIVSVLVDGNNIGAVNTHTFENVNANHTISASFAANTYTVSFNSNGGSAVNNISVTPGNAYGTLPTPTRGGAYSFDGWYSDSNLTKAVTASTLVTATSNHTLYAKWTQLSLASIAKVGDYVRYHPTETSVDLTALTGVSQPGFNPSQTTEWRVLSNNGTVVELVSAESVGYMTLGEYAFYTNGGAERLNYSGIEIAENNYRKIVKILNNISDAYVNDDIGTGRGLGCTSGTKIDLTGYSLNYNVTSGSPYTDTNYSTDVDTLNDRDMLTNDDIWLASRDFVKKSDCAVFYIRSMDSEGNINAAEFDDAGDFSSTALICYSNGDKETNNCKFGVRPVITLNTGLFATNGEGTAESPWTFQQGYTVMFEENGGSELQDIYIPSESIYGILPKPTKSGYALEGWYLDSALTNKVTSSTPVVDNNHTLYAKWRRPTLADVAKVGDYVTYSSNRQSFSLSSITGQSETLNPKDTTSWRVLSNDGTNVEIISASSAGNVTLSGEANYRNLIQILTTISSKFVNSGDGVGRALGTLQGYSLETMDEDDYPFDSIFNTNDGFPYIDQYYYFDTYVLWKYGISYTDEIWTGSRVAMRANLWGGLGAWKFMPDGDVYASWFVDINSDGDAYASPSYSAGVCPVIKLNTGITATGEGTSGSPWVIN